MATSITPLQNEELFTFPAPEDQLRQKEVATLFGRSVQTIINWKKKGKIPYFQMGRFPVFSKKQLHSSCF
ncbi:helix-turn-helix domain-containing protein [Flavobacterium sp. GNP001]